MISDKRLKRFRTLWEQHLKDNKDKVWKTPIYGEEMNTVKVNKDENGEHYFLLKDILKNTTTNVEDVGYYNIETRGKSLVLTLYDKNKKRIEVRDEQAK